MIIAVGNQKGGVGKTTTAFNLAHALVEREKRALLVDLDPQASLTISCKVEDSAGRSLAEVMLGSKKLADILVNLKPGLDLAPGDIALSEAEIILAGKMGREFILKKALAGLKYDYIILDLPPSLSLLTINGLAAADQVLIPAIPVYLDSRALAIFFRTLDQVRIDINPGLQVMGILPTFREGTNLQKDILAAWKKAGLNVLSVEVRRSVRHAEAPISGQPVSSIAGLYANPYRQLAERIDHD